MGGTDERRIMKRFALALSVLTFVGYVPVLSQDTAPIENQQSVKKPLNQAQIFALLAGGVPSHRVAMLVQERGVNFEPTADYVQMVRQTGGEDELVSALKSAKVSPSTIPTGDQTGPSLEATFDFMNQMIEPEKRSVLLGGLIGTLPSGRPHAALVISNQVVLIALPAATTKEHGYPEMLWKLFGDSPVKKRPSYMTFNLGDIDPSSIQSSNGGYNAEALSQFWDQHPNCEANPQCSSLELQFLKSGLHNLTEVSFKTADLKPTIEQGGLETQQACQDSEKNGSECALKPLPTITAASGIILFRDKERAERFVTAFTHAVKLCGGTPSMFPPTESKK